jgi:hypothetical protein
MEHTKHIIRAVLLLVVFAVVFVVVRHFAIPETYGMHGPYRFGSVAEHAASVPAHGGLDACAECHDEEAEVKAEGKHAAVSCEVCHGPLGVHIENDEHIGPMPVNRSFHWCAKCHQRLIARPEEFPQVVILDHIVEKDAAVSEAVCLECHDAHNPSE